MKLSPSSVVVTAGVSGSQRNRAHVWVVPLPSRVTFGGQSPHLSFLCKWPGWKKGSVIFHLLHPLILGYWFVKVWAAPYGYDQWYEYLSQMFSTKCVWPHTQNRSGWRLRCSQLMDGTFLLLLCFPPSCISELNLVMTKGQKIIFFSISHLVYFFTLFDVPWSLTTLVQD